MHQLGIITNLLIDECDVGDFLTAHSGVIPRRRYCTMVMDAAERVITQAGNHGKFVLDHGCTMEEEFFVIRK